MTRHTRMGLLVLPVLLLGVWVYDSAVMIRWIGRTELEVEFVVTDGETSVPIEGARIDVLDEWDRTDKRPNVPWTSITDASGTARRTVEVVCTGKRSGLKLADTFTVRPPQWYYRADATGYLSLDRTPLRDDQGRRADRVRTGHARLVIPIALEKRTRGE